MSETDNVSPTHGFCNIHHYISCAVGVVYHLIYLHCGHHLSVSVPTVEHMRHAGDNYRAADGTAIGAAPDLQGLYG
jgi:hypothetical protein